MLRQIAKQAYVSEFMIRKLRSSICDKNADTKLNNKRKVERGGKTYTQDNTNIGQSKVGEPSTSTKGQEVTSPQKDENQEVTPPPVDQNIYTNKRETDPGL